MPYPLIEAVREFVADAVRQGHPCIVASGADPEEAQPLQSAQFQPGVHLIEGDSLHIRHTGFRPGEHAATSEFRFFLDGIQFSRLIGIIGNAPLIYHLSATAILRRDPATGTFHPWRCSEVCECLLTAKQHLPNAAHLAERLAALGTPLEEIDPEGKTPANAFLLRDRARSKAESLRRKLEVALIREWVEAEQEGWLMVDGPLTPLPGLRLAPRMVGVVKDWRIHYFVGPEQAQILTLPEFFRTSAFQVPRSRARREVEEESETRWGYSWFVRIRKSMGEDPNFGLVRVETPPGIPLPEDADAISRWLIAERAPFSTPDPRWDSLLYPIRQCERYLKSLVPQRNYVRLLFRRALLEAAEMSAPL